MKIDSLFSFLNYANIKLYMFLSNVYNKFVMILNGY